MDPSKAYLISRLLMARRPRMKCLCLVSIVSIIIYVVGSFIWLHIRHNEPVKFLDPRSQPSSIVGMVESNYAKTDHLDLTRTSAEAHVKQEEISDTGETASDNESRKSPDIETKIINITNIESDHSRSMRGSSRKFLFVFRYYEPIGRGTSNLLDLASFAKHKNRLLVVPYVNNSRMSCLPSGLRPYFRKENKTLQRTHALLSEYFNLEDFNSKLKARGYSTLNSFSDFESHCARRLNIVVYFLFANEKFKNNTDLWFGVSENEFAAMYKQAREHNGWINCSVMKQARLGEQMGFKVSRYVCVDPEIVRTASYLEEKILKGANCVAIAQWKGNGQNRVHFPLHSSITRPLRPTDVEFNSHLIELARNFVKNKFNGDFIGVHVRSERHIGRKGVNVTKRCMLTLATLVQESKDAYGIQQVFLASDLADYGSDTVNWYIGKNDLRSLSVFLHKVLNHPETFEPKGVLFDTGAAAIVEMNILSMATRLFTLGGGNFQEWAVGIFLKRHNNDQARVHRMCELDVVQFGAGQRGKNYSSVRILPQKKPADGYIFLNVSGKQII